MNKKLINVLMFATGAAIGSLVTWKVVKTRYERMVQEEVDAFKADYIRCMRNVSNTTNPCENERIDEEDDEYDEDESLEHSDKVRYHALVNRYSKSGDDAENSEEGEGDDVAPYINGPYVITPQDYGDGNFDHNLECVTYYADGVLADSWDVVLDIEETIGEDSLEHFGDHAEDVVHVRNERLQIDYEVVKDPRTYAEILTLTSPINTHGN